MAEGPKVKKGVGLFVGLFLIALVIIVGIGLGVYFGLEKD